MIVPKLQHLSYSNINLYNQCPRCWYLKYVLKYEMPGSVAMYLGSDVHKAIENYHRTGKLPEIIEYIDKETKLLVSNGYLVSMVRAYAEVYKAEDFDFVEEKFTVPIIHPDDPERTHELPLMVVIDRIWDGTIRDVKTSACRYKQEQVDNAMQTILYAYAYRKRFNIMEMGVGYDVIVKNKVPKLQPLDTFVTDESITEALRWVWDTWDKILSDPEPDYHSQNCWNKGLLP